MEQGKGRVKLSGAGEGKSETECETEWSREREESLSTLQKAAFELEKQVACSDKSNKRISGAGSQANRFLSISIARRQTEQNDAEISVEALRQKEDEKVRTRLTA